MDLQHQIKFQQHEEQYKQAKLCKAAVEWWVNKSQKTDKLNNLDLPQCGKYRTDSLTH